MIRIDYSDLEAFSQRLGLAATTVGEALTPPLVHHTEEAARLIEAEAPKRTRRRPPSLTQREAGVITGDPYLIGADRGGARRGPNRFIRRNLEKVAPDLASDVSKILVDLLRR